MVARLENVQFLDRDAHRSVDVKVRIDWSGRRISAVDLRGEAAVLPIDVGALRGSHRRVGAVVVVERVLRCADGA